MRTPLHPAIQQARFQEIADVSQEEILGYPPMQHRCGMMACERTGSR